MLPYLAVNLIFGLLSLSLTLICSVVCIKSFLAFSTTQYLWRVIFIPQHSFLLLLFSLCCSGLFGFVVLGFLLILLLGRLFSLLFFGFFGVKVGLGHIFAEGDGAEGFHAGSHSKDQVGVPGQVLQHVVSRLLVEDQLEAPGEGGDEQGVCQSHLMANEEVAQSEMLVDCNKGLLKLIQAHRESALIALHFPSDLVENTSGRRHDIRLDVVNPGVDLSL